MGNASEREFSERIANVKSKSSKRVGEVIDLFSKMQKLKAESLKKTEEMMGHAAKDLEKLEQEMVKTKGLVSESKERLDGEITAARHQIRQKYDELKTRISAAVTS